MQRKDDIFAMKILKLKTITLHVIASMGLCLSLSSFGHAQIGSETITVPLNFDYDGPMIEVEVNGKTSRLLYDSGANAVGIFEQSAPELRSKILKNVEANVFGGDQTATVKRIEPVTLSWNGIEFDAEKVFLADYTALVPNVVDEPFFEGVIFPVKITDWGHESVTVFDVPNKNILHLALGQKANFETSKSFKLTRKNGWEWRVKMPVMLEGETKKRTLNLVVDTGTGENLILNRERLNIKTNTTGYDPISTGLGGVSNSAYGGRTTFFIGEETVLVQTSILDDAPYKVDGYIGWGFLRRFRTAFDFKKKRMIIDLKDANFTDDKLRKSTFKAGGAPMPDWTGLRVTDVGLWASSGLQIGDVLTSVGGTQLSSNAMYSVLREAQDETKLCWRRNEAAETCG